MISIYVYQVLFLAYFNKLSPFCIRYSSILQVDCMARLLYFFIQGKKRKENVHFCHHKFESEIKALRRAKVTYFYFSLHFSFLSVWLLNRIIQFTRAQNKENTEKIVSHKKLKSHVSDAVAHTRHIQLKLINVPTLNLSLFAFQSLIIFSFFSFCGYF
jgi:hypothetical protein